MQWATRATPTLKAVHVALEPIMRPDVRYACFCQTRILQHGCDDLQTFLPAANVLQPMMHATYVVSKCMQHYSQYLRCNLNPESVANVVAEGFQQALSASHLTTGWTEADLAFVSLSPLTCFDPLIMLLDRPAGMQPKAGIWPRDSGRISSGCAPFMVSRAVRVKLR